MTRDFEYDPDTGTIRRTARQGNYPAGSECGCVRSNGYVYIRVEGKQMLAHRLAWELHTGEPAPEQIDHINRDKTDNRWCNLRAADNSTNQQNIAVHARSKSGIKGIMPVRGGKLYRAEVCIGGKRIQKHSKDPAALLGWLKDTRAVHHSHATEGI